MLRTCKMKHICQHRLTAGHTLIQSEYHASFHFLVILILLLVKLYTSIHTDSYQTYMIKWYFSVEKQETYKLWYFTTLPSSYSS